MYIRKVLNNFLILSALILTDCSCNKYFTIKIEDEIKNSEKCIFYDVKNKIDIIKINFKLRRFRENTNSDRVSCKVWCYDKNKNCIGEVECGGFQSKKYLFFYENGKMKIYNKFYNLEEIYLEFDSFYYRNEFNSDNYFLIWEKIKYFIGEEVFNKYHRINFP